jgi:precorrin-4 methylase
MKGDSLMGKFANLFFATVVSFFIFFLLPFSAHSAQMGKLYVVGMGPAGPDLTAPRALAIVEKADIYLCSPRMPERFARFGMHIDPKKVAFDQWERVMGKDVEKEKKNDPEGAAAQRKERVAKVQEFIMEKLREGKTVVMMDGGDPCVYGPSLHHLLEGFDAALFEVVPGMGAFNAASAALKTTVTPDDVRFVVLTSPESLFGESWEKGDEILKDLSKYETTMVLYMSLSSMNKVVERFRKYYPPDLPIAIVYYAGYPDKERVLKSRLEKIEEDLKEMDEKWLGLVVLGECAK